MFLYPWGDMHSLNLGWFLLQFKDWVEKIQEYLDNGGGTSENLANVIAPVFNAANSYSAGDYVLYNNELYKANQAVAPGTWNPDAWDNCLIVDEMGSGGAGIDNVARLMIAGEYSASFGYQKYAICRYNDKLWMCNTNLPSGGEAWNAAHWDEITVGAGLTGLRRSVETLSEETQKINAKLNPQKIVLISDSYGEDQTAGGKSWETVVDETLTNLTFVKYTRGSGAFGYQDTSNVRYFPKYINDNVAADAAVDMVLMLCGANDGNLVVNGTTTQAYIQNGIAATKTALQAKFPNAKKLVIGFCGNTSLQENKRSYHIARMAYEAGCADNGLIFAFNFHHVLSNPAMINTTDFVHPTLAGSKLLGEAAVDYILSGSIDPFDYYAMPVISSALTATYPDEGSITNNVCVKIGNTVSISARQTGLAKTGTYFIPFVIPEGFRPMANILCPMILQLDSGNSFKIANARVLTNGNIDVQPLTNLTINEWVFSISYATSEI